MDRDTKIEQIEIPNPGTDVSADFQDDFTPDEKKRILKAVKNLDEGKKVYHDLIEAD